MSEQFTVIYRCRRCGENRNLLHVADFTAVRSLLLLGEWEDARNPDFIPCSCTKKGMSIGDMVAYEVSGKQ